MKNIKVEDLEIVLNTMDMAPLELKAEEKRDKELKALSDISDRLDKMSSGNFDGLPPEFDGKDEAAELREALRSSGIAALTFGGLALSHPTTALGAPIAALGAGAVPLINYAVNNWSDERDALKDATVAADPLGIDPRDFSRWSMLPGSTDEDVYRLIQRATEYGVVDDSEDMAALLAAISAIATKENEDPLGYGSLILDYITGNDQERLERDVPGFNIPSNFDEMTDKEAVEEFVSQYWDDYMRAVGPGGIHAEQLQGTYGAWWANNSKLPPSVRLEGPDPLEQLVIDSVNQQQNSLNHQDEKLFNVAATEVFDSLTTSAEDFLGISTYVSDQWIDIRAQMVAARGEGLAPLAEEAQSLYASFEDLRQQHLVEEVLGKEAALEPKAKRKRRVKQERLEDLIYPEGPLLPTYTPRTFTREQKADMYAFKGIGLAGGGLLGDMALVGEEGPELIIDGVVIPAAESRRLMALGLSPQRRLALGGPLDGAYVPRPVDFDPLNVDHRQAIRERNQAVFVPERQSAPKNRDEGGRSKRTQNILGSPEAAPTLRELVMESVAESSQTITETAVGAAAFTQASLASEMLAANINLSRELRQSMQESNQQLLQRVDHLANLTERLILETKRMKIYFRDAVRFIAD
jgi:hypothetical protein